MKKLLKNAGYKLFAIVLALTVFQFSALAEGGKVDQPSSLSGLQVVGLVALLIALVIIPAFKSSHKLTTK